MLRGVLAYARAFWGVIWNILSIYLRFMELMIVVINFEKSIILIVHMNLSRNLITLHVIFIFLQKILYVIIKFITFTKIIYLYIIVILFFFILISVWVIFILYFNSYSLNRQGAFFQVNFDILRVFVNILRFLSILMLVRILILCTSYWFDALLSILLHISFLALGQRRTVIAYICPKTSFYSSIAKNFFFIYLWFSQIFTFLSLLQVSQYSGINFSFKICFQIWLNMLIWSGYVFICFYFCKADLIALHIFSY